MPPVDPLQLSMELRALVWDLARRMRVEAEPVGEVSWSAQSVLRRLRETPRMTSAELARAELVRPQSMNSTVASLREAGLIEGGRSATDGRRVELELTEQGRNTIEGMGVRRNAWLQERIESALDDAQRSELARAVGMLRTLVNEDPQP
ncbi:MAG: MarR family transcriptional regulator [Acidobacteria bacterium]|nr:MarR family transcriptional regulator [Acidobacteriota bacterium]